MKKQHVYPALFSLLLLVVVISFNMLKNSKIINEYKASGKPILIKLFEGKEDLSFRGIAAINDSVVWVSGNFGTFGKSLDGGVNWVFGAIPGADSLQFRDIHLFDEANAIVLGAGAPTAIYITTNGGLTWTLVYSNADTNLFLNAFDFWPDGTGMAFGDPINNRFVLLRTSNYGETWQPDTLSAPLAIPGEAGFAASGSSLRCWGDSSVYIVTGGAQCRLLTSTNRGKQWQSVPLPLQQGSASKGAFSLAINGQSVAIVGGDYAQDTNRAATVVTISPNGQQLPGVGLPYQSAVTYVNDSVLVSTGTPGCYVSLDRGSTWQQFSADAMHTLVAVPSGKNIFSAGPHGRIAKIVWNDQ